MAPPSGVKATSPKRAEKRRNLAPNNEIARRGALAVALETTRYSREMINMIGMDDRDPRFKALLEEFLPEFIELFLSEWADRFDYPRTEWLE